MMKATKVDASANDSVLPLVRQNEALPKRARIMRERE